jgi:uncharacterized protein YbaP (TraB family)
MLANFAVSAVWADTPHHTLWIARGEHNTVYLLGSVHVLQPQNSELPPEALRAYASAKALVMELDPDQLTADTLLNSSLDLQTLAEGQSLEGVLGHVAYARLVAHVKPLGLDPEFLAHFQPWLVATMVEQLELARLGFDPNAGVDLQFAQRAQADHKPVIALETVDQQLGVFAHMPLDQQRKYLLHSLDEADKAPQSMGAIVNAWRVGDTLTLEHQLREDSARFPDLYRRLTTDRNRQWLPIITGLLRDDQDYLVIVGALHLVGHDGVVELLKRAGYQVVQH